MRWMLWPMWPSSLPTAHYGLTCTTRPLWDRAFSNNPPSPHGRGGCGHKYHCGAHHVGQGYDQIGGNWGWRDCVNCSREGHFKVCHNGSDRGWMSFILIMLGHRLLRYGSFKIKWKIIVQCECVCSSIRFMDEFCDWICGSKGRIDSFGANLCFFL